ncbi:MAG: Asp-tRNA(Asn)/Glu-tRNA(Gln) amidotransferase subunit GatC [Desulfovibrio sp.]|nr:Asp-tRNA(Asn)/Glu-tRNA(Gln) amidotransferase subunit GatC [Desulfovibrio sp.]
MAKEVSPADVRHMALLSRLLISPEEEKLFQRQFGEILDHISVLESVDTEAMEPLYWPACHPGLTRLDEAADIRTRQDVLANAPETDGECFLVPRII